MGQNYGTGKPPFSFGENFVPKGVLFGTYETDMATTNGSDTAAINESRQSFFSIARDIHRLTVWPVPVHLSTNLDFPGLFSVHLHLQTHIAAAPAS